jgi:hypothetical protein
MHPNTLIETVYDILAQNPVKESDKQHVLDHIDHVDYDALEIVFINPNNNKQYALKLEAR